MIEFILIWFRTCWVHGLLLAALAFKMFPSLDVPGPIGLVYAIAVWVACTVLAPFVISIPVLIHKLFIHIRRKS